MDLSARINSVAPSPTLAISARAQSMRADGIDVISLSAGEPDFPTPEPIVEAAKQAMDEGKTGYVAARGIEPLREAIASDYERRGRDIDADQVVVSVGAKQGLYNAAQVLFEQGDRVLVPTPYWVSYPAQVKLAGAEPVTLECGIDAEFKLRPKQLADALSGGSVKGLILCTPSNPTGATYSAAELRALGDVLTDYPDVAVIFDAIYDQIYYGGDLSADLVAEVPELEDQVITFNGFSKAYAMTGWRLGYALGPEETIGAMGKIQSQSTSNATTFVQYAALEAFNLTDSLLTERRDRFQERRDLILSKIEAFEGVDCPKPEGAFYVFPDFSTYIGADAPFEDDMELAEFCLEEAHVATVPGSAFGADGHLRFSYAASESDIEEALDRLIEALPEV
jgi:aspartate aminotransferase